MGCGASSGGKDAFVSTKEKDPTLPDNMVKEPFKVESFNDVVQHQKGEGVAQGNGVRVAQIAIGKNVDDFYDTQDILGSGLSGAVYRAKSRSSGSHVAIKRISYAFLSKREEQLLYSEVNVALLMDHPHIARLFEVYQEEHSLTLCIEICEGGALLDHVQKKGHCSEREAAVITKQMCQAVAYMHSTGTPGGRICHRDLKLENFMFATSNISEPHIKLIDFGLSKVVERGSNMTLFAGSVHYLSPELLNRSYDYRCDLWALGVVVYLMIFGKPPFTVNNTAVTHKRIRSGKYAIRHKISPQCKDFLSRLIHLSPEQRVAAEDMVDHEWIRMNCDATQDLDVQTVALSEEVVAGIRAYAASGVFKRAALKLVSLSMPVQQLSECRKAFEGLDAGSHGVITLQEFKQVLLATSSMSSASMDEIEALFAKLDLNRSETIQYSEFIAACMQTKFDHAMCNAQLEHVFKKFDRDSSGKITAGNLREILGEQYNDVRVEDLIAECDGNKDGAIDLNEFLAYVSSAVVKDAFDPRIEDGLVGVAGTNLIDAEEDNKENADFQFVQASGAVSTEEQGGMGQVQHVRRADAFRVVEGIISKTE